jgi:thiol-disulfide isomerase/thioredoxin
MAHIQEISNDMQFNSVINGRGKNIIFFGSLRCGHCRNITPFVGTLSQQYDKGAAPIKFWHVETSTVKTEGIKGVPVFTAYDNGKYVDYLEGASRAGLEKMCRILSAQR